MNMEKIFERRSVRTFLDKEVTIDEVKEMIFAAMQAPSARHQLPWDYVIIDKEEIPYLMYASSGAKALKEANKVVILVMNEGLICPEFAPQDMASTLTYLMLAARSKNIGSIWVGIYPHEERVSYLNDYLKIKEPYKAFAMVGLGYPSDDEAFKILNERFDEKKIHIGKW